jgi:hypothetical protein
LSAPVHFNETLFITSKIVGGSMQQQAARPHYSMSGINSLRQLLMGMQQS